MVRAAARREPKSLRLGRSMASYAREGLIVTPAVQRWMLETGGELTISPEHAARILSLLTEAPRDRSGSFSPSARGNCLRAQALGFLGAPQTPLEPAVVNLFMDGRFRHLKWQALGLEVGFLDEVEVNVKMPAWMAQGSIDGTGPDYGFELKGTRMALPIIESAYQLVMQALDIHKEPATNKGNYHVKMMWKHIHQIHGYLHQLQETGQGHIKKFVLLYEHKETQEWVEFVIDENEWMKEKVTKELETLNRSVKMRSLPQVLDDCRPEPVKSCPYHLICHDPYDHLPEKWQEFMSTPVRLTVTKPRPVPVAEPKKTFKLKVPKEWADYEQF